MKLLIDENLPARLKALLDPHFPGTDHVKHANLMQADDMDVWRFAKEEGFCILTKDKDFQQLSVFHGAPPKVIWLRIGNASTKRIMNMMEHERASILHFLEHPHRTVLLLTH